MEVFKKAVNSGLSGYKAMTIQVFTFMWLRTVMNYQYKNGGTFKEVALKLYKEGGIKRFYLGIIPALIQGPLCRFGDTFSNTIILNFLKNIYIPIFLQTVLASITAAFIRIILTPVDIVKTIQQVEGKTALSKLKDRIKEKGIISLFDGALANGLLGLIGHYPWFVMHNYLDKYLPGANGGPGLILFRNAFIGFVSSCFSDTISNSVRVLKTSIQTTDGKKSYKEIYKNIKNKEGKTGILFRGLNTRLFTNGMQGLLFNVLWKFFGGTKNKVLMNYSFYIYIIVIFLICFSNEIKKLVNKFFGEEKSLDINDTRDGDTIKIKVAIIIIFSILMIFPNKKYSSNYTNSVN